MIRVGYITWAEDTIKTAFVEGGNSEHQSVTRISLQEIYTHRPIGNVAGCPCGGRVTTTTVCFTYDASIREFRCERCNAVLQWEDTIDDLRSQEVPEVQEK